MKIETALLSVSDKTGIVEFARALARGVRLLSTGGTAKLLAESGLNVTEVAAHTGSPEILDGRVKTLHPKIHGGLLARRDSAEHMDTIKAAGIDRIDMLVVNLYPFRETVAKPGCTFADAVENIDIGGPAMLRAAAKNHGTEAGGVTVVIDPVDYSRVLGEMDKGGNTSYGLRLELAGKVYAHTAAYDGAIAAYLSSLAEAEQAGRRPGPQRMAGHADAAGQAAAGPALRREPADRGLLRRSATSGRPAGQLPPAAGQGTVVQQHRRRRRGLGMRAQLRGARLRHRQARQPCGVAVAANTLGAYQQAFKTDPTSAFGGIIAFNRPVDAATAEAVSAQFLEVLLAPAYDGAALAILAAKKNVRVLEVPMGAGQNAFDVKRVGGGWLVQTPDAYNVPRDAQDRDQAPAHRTGNGRPGLRLEGRQVRQVQRHRVRGRRHDAGRGRRPDEPHRLGPHRLDQGRERRPDAQGLGRGVGRVLPVPRWPGRGGGGGRDLRDPARRQRA